MARDDERSSRPFVVSLASAMMLLGSLVQIILGVAFALRRHDEELLARFDAEPSTLLAAAGFSVVDGALVALFAILLLRGNRFGRAILGLSLLGDVVSGAYSSVALEDTVRLIGVAQIVGAVLALYLLYGTEKAQRYFD